MSDFRLGTRAILVEQLVRLAYRPLLLAALVVWFRGHNAPGGGFIAGLLAVAATASYALAFGGWAARARLPLAPEALAALGVGMSALAGVPAIVAGQPFLTHVSGEVALAGIVLPWSTVMLFDLGVMLCVWGGLAALVLALWRKT